MVYGQVNSSQTNFFKLPHLQRVNVLKTPSDTHQGLLLGYSEIKKPKPVSLIEIKNYIFDAGRNVHCSDKAMDLIKRIEQNGIE